ncbi:prolipoprotein diacylglyceryl transferase [Spiroplasma clarkii]|uniref:prolipoprotein diacylglyceryl transferase family protein n=1 Tax=Spiroplasma clarkii TaxID=2139 RepID=UPI000B55FD12|nr:prolipoprotein diacylglyceryl transferase family protein [Spiroplasma clarkii]ARU92301.1 prolipoprotein diacylglyceryl transferase [Spiroplasma clarkii]
MKTNILTNNPYWDQWINTGNGETLSFLYGVLAIAGILTTIAAAATTFAIKKVPMREFMHSIYIMIPAALVGGSLFGKLGTNIVWYRVFFFWEPGLSIFASLLFGSFAGYLWFSRVKYRHNISIWVYADAIIPHMFLGQAIGRWGNLFNHELLGKPIDIEKYQWLPNFIWQRLFYFYDSASGAPVDALVYRQPLFLYESFATLTAWIIIVFLVPLLFKLISKKPWKLDPLAFPTRAKPLPIDAIKVLPNYFEVIYNRKKTTKQSDMINKELLFLSKSNIWKKAYYAYEVDETVAQQFQQEINQHRENRLKALKRYNDGKAKLVESIATKQDKVTKQKLNKTEFKNLKI